MSRRRWHVFGRDILGAMQRLHRRHSYSGVRLHSELLIWRMTIGDGDVQATHLEVDRKTASRSTRFLRIPSRQQMENAAGSVEPRLRVRPQRNAVLDHVSRIEDRMLGRGLAEFVVNEREPQTSPARLPQDAALSLCGILQVRCRAASKASDPPVWTDRTSIGPRSHIHLSGIAVRCDGPLHAPANPWKF